MHMAEVMANDFLINSLLHQNQNTELGKLWNLKDIKSVEEFRRKLPLTTYDDYRPHIDRIANHGDQYLMTSEKIVQLVPSSGTTGDTKYIPMPQSTFEMNVPVPDCSEKTLLLLGSLPIALKQYSPSGLCIEGVSITMFKRLIQLYPKTYFIPLEAYKLPFEAAMYVQLVLGLKNPTVNGITSLFIPHTIKFVTTLKSSHTQMLVDIRTGTLDPSLPIPPDKRQALEASMGGPDPTRADQLQQIFQLAEKNSYKDVLPAIWPSLKHIHCSCSGNMSSYLPTLQYYSSPGVGVYSRVYACSEAGLLGFAVKPCGPFRLVPQNFYEFIRQSDSGETNPPTLLGNELKEGEVYEIVLTLPCGYYRYRIGDFVKVIKQTEAGPLIDLYGRTKMTLQLQGHVLHEMSMELVITTLTLKTPSRIDYIFSIDDSTACNRYKLWIETDDAGINQQTDLDKLIDEELQGIDSSYNEARKTGRIEQITVVFVKEGTFGSILNFKKSKAICYTEAQWKVPRIAIYEEMKKHLQENVLHNVEL